MAPASTMMTAMAEAKIGRWMKKLTMEIQIAGLSGRAVLGGGLDARGLDAVGDEALPVGLAVSPLRGQHRRRTFAEALRDVNQIGSQRRRVDAVRLHQAE